MRIFHLPFFFILLSTVSLYGQPWMKNLPDGTRDFYAIQSEFRKYWAGREPVETRSDSGEEEGNGWMIFKRWEWFMAPRVYPSGQLPEPGILQSQIKSFSSNSLMHVTSSSNWSPMGPAIIPTNGGVGRINCIAINPTNTNVIWVGSASGGLWKSTNGGATWLTNTDFLGTLGISSIAFNPLNPNTMYIATGDADHGDTRSIGVLKSTDSGANWNTTGFNQIYDIYSIVLHPTDTTILLAVSSQGIYRTSNGGTNWTTIISGGNGFQDLAVNPSNPTIWFAARNSVGIYKSTNTGNSFSQVTSGLPTTGFDRIAVAVAPSLASTVYALYSASGFFGLYRSTDSGTNWTLQSNSPNILSWDGTGTGGQGWYDLVLEVDPNSSSTVYVGGVNLYRSTSGGTIWAKLTHWYGGTGLPYIHADQHGFAFLPGSSTTFFAGNDGGIFRTTNSGAIWSDLSAGLAITQFYRLGCSATNPNRVFAGAQDNFSNRYLNGAWEAILGGDGMETLIDYSNENIGYCEQYNGKIYRTTNGGGSMTLISTGIPDVGAWVTPYVINPLNPKSIYVLENGLYKSTNRGDAWTTLSSGLDFTPMIALAIAPSDSNILYAAGYSLLLVSTTSGLSWTNITGSFPTSAITSVAVHPSNPSAAYVTFSGYGSQKVFKTTNRGSTWTNISTGLPAIPTNTIVVNPSNSDLYVGTDFGVYQSRNDGASWYSFSNGLPNVVIDELEIQVSSQKLRAATYGRGLWEAPITFQQPASIAGRKFNDLNNNGIKDPGEIGVQNWRIRLTGVSTDSVLTDLNGNYSFMGLDVGTYTVGEATFPGWVQTFPNAPSTYTITLSSGQNSTENDFGNFHPGSISGMFFEDGNGDGTKGSVEPVLQNWKVRLLGARTDSTLTDAGGNYTFNNLLAGIYVVREDVPSGWHVSLPVSGDYPITVTGTNNVTGKNFGNYRFGSIRGKKFNDMNHNGVRDGGDSGIAGWTIRLSGSSTSSAATDTAGSYAFQDLKPGSYTVSESTMFGWIQTMPPARGSYAMSIHSGLDTAGIEFGNYFLPPDSFAVSSGWNLLSLPRDVPDHARNVIYPSATSPAFIYKTGYSAIDTIPNGLGYWLKFPSEENIPIQGPDISQESVKVIRGWNIVGTLAIPIGVPNVLELPPGIVISPYFSFTGIYEIADSLRPHLGYWVKVSGDGTLVMATAPGQIATASIRRLDIGECNTISIRDITGKRQTLFFGQNETLIKSMRLFGLPPLPPETGFDVRFSNGSLAWIPASENDRVSLKIQGASFPVYLSWKLSDAAVTYSISEQSGRIRTAVLTGIGNLTMTDSAVNIMTLSSTRNNDLVHQSIPLNSTLEQNYPNPFNPTTLFRYQLAFRSKVTLKVFDVLGREMKTLVNGVQEPGDKSIEWDASSVASGIYFYRLEATSVADPGKSFMQVRKMILMR